MFNDLCSEEENLTEETLNRSMFAKYINKLLWHLDITMIKIAAGARTIPTINILTNYKLYFELNQLVNELTY